MSDELLPYYSRELTFIRKMGDEFSRAHPDMAGRLRLGQDGVSDDPHVERLIEAFAYLTARVRHKIDDDFPEITEAFLNVLYPHYQAPLPSMAVVQMALGPDQGGLVAGYPIPRDTVLETEPVDGETCHFRTCYPLRLWPITVAAGELSRLQSKIPAPKAATAMLRLELRCVSAEMTFGKLALPSLRFFLRGEPQHTRLLYQLILNHAVEVVLSTGMHKAVPIRLDKDCLRPVGFAREEAVLPIAPRSFPGYRLLSEYFAFPEKFLFFDLEGLGPELLSGIGNQLEILVFLNRTDADVEHNVTAETFRIGCTPVINLFQPKPGAEPIVLGQTALSYRVVPDFRRPKAMEVYSVDRVVATAPSGQELEFQPFYSIRHGVDRKVQQTFWYATRHPAEQVEGHDDEGTEVELSFVDLAFNAKAPADWVVHVDTTCLNRDLPSRLTYGGGRPFINLRDGGPITKIECLTPPTPTYRPPRERGLMWRIISHITLNHLSITDGERGADALREILTLYDYVNSPGVREKINGILSVRSRRVPFRAGRELPGAFCRGVEVTIEFDEERFTDNGMFLFATVLEHFLGLYCSVNSFSQLVARTNKQNEELRRWPPRAGEKTLL